MRIRNLLRKRRTSIIMVDANPWVTPVHISSDCMLTVSNCPDRVIPFTAPSLPPPNAITFVLYTVFRTLSTRSFSKSYNRTKVDQLFALYNEYRLRSDDLTNVDTKSQPTDRTWYCHGAVKHLSHSCNISHSITFPNRIFSLISAICRTRCTHHYRSSGEPFLGTHGEQQCADYHSMR